MNMGIKQIRKRNLYEEIAEQMMQLIAQGYYKPGQQLPGERDLAVQLGVNRGSLREALRVLEFMRVVEKRVGEGVFVLDPARTSSLEAIIFRFLHEDGLDRGVLSSAGEAITIVESNMAKLAARRASEGGIVRLQKVLDRMHSHLEDAPAFTELDQEFHIQLGQMSHSPVLFSIASSMWVIMRKYAHALHLYPQRRQKCYQGHQLILEAITQGDEEKACHEMEHHYKGAFSVLLAEL